MTKVQQLINGTPIFYEDYFGKLDFKEHFVMPRKLYAAARNEVKLWLEDVLTRELRENDKLAGVSATIFLPMRDMTVEVFGAGVVSIELFHTPIGVIDRYTYEEIIKGGNPLKELLDFLHDTYNEWKSQLSYAVREDEFPLVTKELRELWGWKDPLSIYELFPMMESYEKFMTGNMYSE